LKEEEVVDADPKVLPHADPEVPLPAELEL
jgi:hypothetical protein